MNEYKLKKWLLIIAGLAEVIALLLTICGESNLAITPILAAAGVSIIYLLLED